MMLYLISLKLWSRGTYLNTRSRGTYLNTRTTLPYLLTTVVTTLSNISYFEIPVLQNRISTCNWSARQFRHTFTPTKAYSYGCRNTWHVQHLTELPE